MTITADGGWFVALLLLALLVVGVMAYRKRWPSRKPLFATGGASVGESQQKQTVKVVEKTSYRSGGSGNAGRVRTVVLVLLGIAAAIIIIRSLPLVVDTFFRFIGIQVVTPQQYARMHAYAAPPVYVAPTKSEVRSTVREQCIREDEVEIPVHPVYGQPQRWERVPNTLLPCVIVDGKKPIDAQCSSSDEKPPTDASGPDYDCRSDVYAHWVRVMASNVEEGPVTAWIFFQDWR